MGDVDDYLGTIDGADRAAMERVYAVARDVVPDAEQGTSYGMAALLHRGKGLVATVRTKRFLSLYPFSGSVVAALADDLEGFETTSGSIHYSADHPLPDGVLRRIVEVRRAEIEVAARR
ncbi:MAG TPA: DUF1801 domain-containing protein [Nocardioides sp.]|nr:DUF1801 domain-containing protein [Nocardioides sp.]